MRNGDNVYIKNKVLAYENGYPQYLKGYVVAVSNEIFHIVGDGENIHSKVVIVKTEDGEVTPYFLKDVGYIKDLNIPKINKPLEFKELVEID